MTSISKGLKYSDRFNLNFPHLKKKGSIFDIDLFSLVVKYPLLWSWLLDSDVPDMYVSNPTYGSNELVNLNANDQQTVEEVMASIGSNTNNSTLTLDQKINEARAFLYNNSIESLPIKMYKTIEQQFGNQVQYINDLQNQIQNLQNQVQNLQNQNLTDKQKFDQFASYVQQTMPDDPYGIYQAPNYWDHTWSGNFEKSKALQAKAEADWENFGKF